MRRGVAETIARQQKRPASSPRSDVVAAGVFPAADPTRPEGSPPAPPAPKDKPGGLPTPRSGRVVHQVVARLVHRHAVGDPVLRWHDCARAQRQNLYPMNSPKAPGLAPTVTVAVTVFVPVSITETVTSR